MITFKNVFKIYDNKIVVNNISLDIRDGEFVVFIGTSGSGKTTCLRMINKMVDVTKGSLFIDKEDINSLDEVSLRRRIGYVIQQIGLIPHMTIYDNIVMVPKLLKWSKEKQREIALQLLERVNLPESILTQYPSQLSGGQQQRIGVIRALAADQNIILMDEPFGALDSITRSSLQQLIKELHKDLKKTFVFVTHDIDEAILLADKIVILDKGNIVQMGSPQSILIQPANKFVEELLGEKRMEKARFEACYAEGVMRKDIITITQEESVERALQILIENELEYLYVIDEKGVIKGYVDIYTLAGDINKKEPVREHVLYTPYINYTMPLKEILVNFVKLGYKKLPVVNDEFRILGEISQTYVTKLLYGKV